MGRSLNSEARFCTAAGGNFEPKSQLLASYGKPVSWVNWVN